MGSGAMASRLIARAADQIEQRQYVSMDAIPALVVLLRGLADAAEEHGEDGFPTEQLCSDELDALAVARQELGEQI